MNVFFMIFFQLTLAQYICPDSKPEILLAESQKYYGGHATAGYGVKYKFEIIPNNTSDKIDFQWLWVDGKRTKLNVFKKGGNRSDTIFSKNDTLIGLAQIHFYPENIERKADWIVENLPIKTDAVALVGYKLKSKQKYAEIKQFTILETEHRQ